MNTTGKPVNISKYPIVKQAYELCLAIEDLPASEGQTEISIEASEVKDALWSLLEGSPITDSRLSVRDKQLIDDAWKEYARTHPVMCE